VDNETTLDVVRVLGGQIRPQGNDLLISGIEGRVSEGAEIDCGNSGTTMRLLMGILAGCDGDFVLDGDASLRNRPMERVAVPLRQMEAVVECVDGKPPVGMRGGSLKGIEYALPVASAQLKSAVLLAGIQAQGFTRVLEPVPSRDHTERLFAHCNANISAFKDGWRVERSTPEMPGTLVIPGDISSAAFFLCGGVILPESEVSAEGILLNPLRTGCLDVLSRMGARIEIVSAEHGLEPIGVARATYSPELRGCEVGAAEIPSLVDEVPILALVATQARGTSVFRDVGELRVKESDRLEAIITQLGAMGAHLSMNGDNLVVEGPTPLRVSGALQSFGDHRIAMTLRIACQLSDSGAEIDGEECVTISYPNFQKTLEELST
jgi:3-phosphoshikimate 1-carboxyvinyltransferase